MQFLWFSATLLPGVLCLAAVDLPWQDQLCCESPPAHRAVEGEHSVHMSERRNGSVPNVPPHCSYRNSSSSPSPEESSAGESLQGVRQVKKMWLMRWRPAGCVTHLSLTPCAGEILAFLRCRNLIWGYKPDLAYFAITLFSRNHKKQITLNDTKNRLLHEEGPMLLKCLPTSLCWKTILTRTISI